MATKAPYSRLIAALGSAMKEVGGGRTSHPPLLLCYGSFFEERNGSRSRIDLTTLKPGQR
jgi:hypothetical protein